MLALLLFSIILAQHFPLSEDVDGFLVGGASLKPEFADFVNARKDKVLETRQLEIP
jgi:hypothetical protein